MKMTEFHVAAWGKKPERCVQATTCESAVKKAHGTPRGWHWERSVEGTAVHQVVDGRLLDPQHFQLQDNG